MQNSGGKFENPDGKFCSPEKILKKRLLLHCGKRFGGKQAAEEEMLTPERLNWTIGATVGVKFSRAFALGK